MVISRSCPMVRTVPTAVWLICLHHRAVQVDDLRRRTMGNNRVRATSSVAGWALEEIGVSEKSFRSIDQAIKFFVHFSNESNSGRGSKKSTRYRTPSAPWWRLSRILSYVLAILPMYVFIWPLIVLEMRSVYNRLSFMYHMCVLWKDFPCIISAV